MPQQWHRQRHPQLIRTCPDMEARQERGAWLADPARYMDTPNLGNGRAPHSAELAARDGGYRHVNMQGCG